ncbi:MAG TPA: DUF455 family protein [Planctomycetaceae bacterium]|nr:DUF455 family protein [Planctomycetaceae bacterium]
MELRDFAERIVCLPALDEKLARPSEPLTDHAPGTAVRVSVPARPPELRFAGRREAPAMPAPGAFRDPGKRAVAHHIMANHELQACEVMAWVLLAFPEAPAEFRRGLAGIIQDEQRHTRMHVERAAALGLRFGELPVNAHIWKKSQSFQSVLDYVSGLPLVFEGRNLDHTLEFEAYFRAAGDDTSAGVMRAIHRDEIEHVRFGLEWLRRLKPADQSDWEAWEQHLHWPLRPEKARGDVFDRESRLAAGMTEEFVERLESANQGTA